MLKIVTFFPLALLICNLHCAHQLHICCRLIGRLPGFYGLPNVCSGNAIDVTGAKALAEALAANGTLTSLVLSDNYIGVEGAKALAEALTQNKALTELSIKGNELGDEGVEALATALLVSEWCSININPWYCMFSVGSSA
jgi:hypothetical protein